LRFQQGDEQIDQQATRHEQTDQFRTSHRSPPMSRSQRTSIPQDSTAKTASPVMKQISHMVSLRVTLVANRIRAIAASDDCHPDRARTKPVTPKRRAL